MERCKFCGEVLETDYKFCPYCGKDVTKAPSKRQLKKQEKEKNFVVNNDARLYRVSYRIFGTLFFIVGLLAIALYGQWFLAVALEKAEWATKFTDVINKAGNISTKMEKWVPFLITIDKEFTFVFIVSACALLLSIFSLFTKKSSFGAVCYKLSAIFGTIFFIVTLMITQFVPFEVPASVLEFILENEKMIIYIGSGLALGFFVLGLLGSFNVKNPYRPTLFQGFKALYWGAIAATFLIDLLVAELDLNVKILEITEKVYNYAFTLMPAYIFVSSLLMFIGAKYRGNIERLK